MRRLTAMRTDIVSFWKIGDWWCFRAEGKDNMATNLVLNGREASSKADPDTPLLYVLRDEFELNGAKYGCGIGQCGSCTVMIDGVAAFSCMTTLSQVAGAEVTTVEGLGTAGSPGLVQNAFIEEQAVQCGYCIPGIVVRTEALLAENPDPDDSEIIAALSSHLCRCGTHMRILRAVRRARDEMRGEGEPT